MVFWFLKISKIMLVDMKYKLKKFGNFRVHVFEGLKV